MTQAGRAEVFKWRKVGLAMRVTLALKKGHPARGWGGGGRVTLLADPTISVSHANGSPCFVRKCKKSFFQEAR